MKYTRYNLKPKRKKENNFLFYFAITLLIALLLGTVINSFIKKSGSLWFKQDLVSGEENKGQVVDEKRQSVEEKNEIQGEEETSPMSVVEGKDIYEFYILQCGAFKVKENAQSIMDKLSTVGTPFVVEDGELVKVYFNICSSETMENTNAALKEVGVDSSKVVIKINGGDLSEVQLCKSVQGLLQIVDKFRESGVKSIETKELKTWAEGLEKIEAGQKAYDDVNTIKTYIASLPEEVEKSKGQEMLNNIYNIIIKYKK